MDQCAFGLQLPGAEPLEKVQKDTFVFSNALLGMLACRCDKSHVPLQLIGSVKICNVWTTCSSLAGAYPPGLCRKWAQVAERGFRFASRPMGRDLFSTRICSSYREQMAKSYCAIREFCRSRDFPDPDMVDTDVSLTNAVSTAFGAVRV